MSEAQTMAARPNLDIAEDIDTLIVHYPPLVNDRHHFHADVVDGMVTLTGHVKTPITRQYLVNGVAVIKDVKGIDADRLFDDETVRFEVGRLLPFGVIANVEYGTVVLTGTQPKTLSADGVIEPLRAIPGIKRVVTSFRQEPA